MSAPRAATQLPPVSLGCSFRPLVLCLLNGWCFVAPSLACGEARGGSIPRSGAVTDEQRSHRPTWAQPKGRQSFSLQASLLTPYRSTSGYARRSRLAWTEKPLPQNTSHLGDTTLAAELQARVGFQERLEIRPAGLIHFVEGMEIDGHHLGRMFRQHGIHGRAKFGVVHRPWQIVHHPVFVR